MSRQTLDFFVGAAIMPYSVVTPSWQKIHLNFKLTSALRLDHHSYLNFIQTHQVCPSHVFHRHLQLLVRTKSVRLYARSPMHGADIRFRWRRDGATSATHQKGVDTCFALIKASSLERCDHVTNFIHFFARCPLRLNYSPMWN